jgi:Rrf2 family protein
MRASRNAIPGVVVPARLDYGLRGLLEVARSGGRRVKVERVATQHGLSQKFLATTLTTLRHAGIVDALRGTDGGYRLARAPDQITVVEVFDALGDEADGVPEPAWVCIEDAVRTALAALTLADLLAAAGALA